MKTTRFYPKYLYPLLGIITSIVITTRVSAAPIVTNWVAYQDYRPNFTPVNGWVTAPNVNTYDLRLGPGGPLTNFYNGALTPVSVAVAANGTPDDFGTAARPNDNTPLASLFKGVVDVGNDGLIGVRLSANTYVTLTFSGLDPAKHYLFRGTSVRGGDYGLRWTVATLIGATDWVDAHLNGTVRPVITSNDFPGDLVAGQAAWDSGENRDGAVVGWDYIAPAVDGTFSIQSSNYVGRIPGGVFAVNNAYGYAVGAFLLAEVEPAAVSIVTNPPANVTVGQNRPLTLSVVASGYPLLYQWYKTGVGEITGATRATYSVPSAALGDAGDYYVRVYNVLGSATSTVAHVTVSTDSAPPAVLSAFSFPSFDPATQVTTLNQVTVEFNEIVDVASATTVTNYVVSSGLGSPVSVTLTNNNQSALLTYASVLAEDTAYTITVRGVRDIVGNAMTSTVTPFRTWMRGAGNALLFEYYDTGAGVDVAVLTNHVSFPNSPTFRTNLWAFDTRVVFPDDTQGGYGSRISGVFIPPFSGDWVFFLRAWDRGAVFFNPNGMDPAGRQQILAEVTGNNPREWNKYASPPFRLRGGQGYYIEGLQKAETGVATDVIKVGARPAGTGFPPVPMPDTIVDTNSLMGGYIASPLAPRDLGGTIAITQNPTNQTVEENHEAVFSVQVSNPSLAPLHYQWFRDGVEIVGAAGPTYRFPVTSADNNHIFRVRVAKVGSEVTSQNATLTVIPDTTGPHAIEAISASTNLFSIIVRFDELINPDDADEPFDFYLQGIGPPTSAVAGSDGKSSIIGYDTPLTSGTVYHLDVLDLRDLAGNPISPNPTTLTFTAGEGDLPRLTATYSDFYVYVSWPAPSTGFVLEQSSSLSTPNWTTVSQTPVVSGGRNTVTLTPGAGAETRFYRLKQ